MIKNNMHYLLMIVFFNSCHSQIKNYDLNYLKDLNEKLQHASRRDSANHLDAIDFDLRVMKKDTIINHKRFFALKLDSKNNLVNDIKYFLNYNKEGIFISTIIDNESQERVLLRFNNAQSDMISTLYRRFEFFQLLKQSDSEYKFQYIQDPYQIELYYMYGDKIVIKNKDEQKINLILFYHDRFMTFHKEIEIPYDNKSY